MGHGNKEEIFGPVCHITPFDREEQAVAMANDSRYGLAAVVMKAVAYKPVENRRS